MANCDSFGCGGNYQSKKPCQCIKGCAAHGNCCSDYEAVCESPEALAAEAACDAKCELKGSSYSCRARVDYELQHNHRSKADAIEAVNDECADQCSCTTTSYASLLQSFDEPEEHEDYVDDEVRVQSPDVPEGSPAEPVTYGKQADEIAVMIQKKEEMEKKKQELLAQHLDEVDEIVKKEKELMERKHQLLSQLEDIQKAFA